MQTLSHQVTAVLSELKFIRNQSETPGVHESIIFCPFFGIKYMTASIQCKRKTTQTWLSLAVIAFLCLQSFGRTCPFESLARTKQLREICVIHTKKTVFCLNDSEHAKTRKSTCTGSFCALNSIVRQHVILEAEADTERKNAAEFDRVHQDARDLIETAGHWTKYWKCIKKARTHLTDLQHSRRNMNDPEARKQLRSAKDYLQRAINKLEELTVYVRTAVLGASTAVLYFTEKPALAAPPLFLAAPFEAYENSLGEKLECLKSTYNLLNDATNAKRCNTCGALCPPL